MIKTLKLCFVAAVFLLAVLTAAAQTKGRKPVVKKPATNPVAAESKPTATPTPATLPGKRNERPDSGQSSTANGKSTPAVSDPPYFYEFEQPKFTITKITIKHDETGKGELTFKKGEFDEPITEPIKLSQTILDKIVASITALDFFNSTENYQYEKDYSHLGNITFRLRKDGREREIHFNYTTNKDAKDLADEYRRISNQIIWVFDVNVARENQPLDAPRQMDALESYMQRNEIADPTQLLEFLRSLSQDERIPLIARNHAGKIIKKIEKIKK
ncbi:MAG: hypothetical protein ABI878_10245 [Acidobacteriota bacterium]